METIAIFIPIIAILGIVTMIIFLRKFTNEERMAMIEKGADPSLFKGHQSGGNIALKIGLLFIGAGIGLLVGALLATNVSIEEPVAYFSMLFLFGGLGLFASHYLEQKQRQKENG